MSITILDVHSAVYGAHKGNPIFKCGFPIAGIAKVFGILNGSISREDFALCFDGDDIIKKELYPEYKANRIPDYSVYAQIDFLKELLDLCNIPYFYSKKQEADDYIFTLCHDLSFLSKGEEKITVMSDDRDMACCVTENISLRNITTNGKSITKDNFSARAVSEKAILFNTILLYKLFYGDKSDHYTGIKISGLSYDVLASIVVDTLQPLIDSGEFCEIQYSDFEVFCIIVDSIDFISESDKEALKHHARLVFPYRVPLGSLSLQDYYKESLTSPMYKVHRKMGIAGSNEIYSSTFFDICNTLGVSRKGTESQQLLDLLSLKAKALMEGDFIASKVIHKKIEKPQAGQLVNMRIDEELFR